MTELNFTQEEANQFIIDCHSDLEKVKQKASVKPGLVNAYNPETIESALGAAGHMGRADIARFLLDLGAHLELATAAMLGMRAEVSKALQGDPALAKSGGAHNIPIAFHAAISGDTHIMQMLWDAGAQQEVKNALFGAITHNRINMVRWLLEHGSSTEIKSPNGKSPLEFARENGYLEIVDLLRNETSPQHKTS